MNDKEQLHAFSRSAVLLPLNIKRYTAALDFHQFPLHLHEVGESEGHDHHNKS